MIKSILPILGAVALVSFALLQPEISGAGLAWAFMIYGIGILAIPTALFGNLFVLAGVAFVVTGHARGWQPWPKTAWLRSWGRFRRGDCVWLAQPASLPRRPGHGVRPAAVRLGMVAQTAHDRCLDSAVRVLDRAGLRSRVQPTFALRARICLRALLLASLGCLLAFTIKDAWLFLETNPQEGASQTRFLNLLRLCPLYLIPALLLWDYLRFSSIVPPKSTKDEETEKPARPARNFFLLPDRASRFVVAFVMAGALVTFALAAHRRSEGSVRKLVTGHRASIQSAAARCNVDPRLIASIVYVTHRDQISPFRESFERLIINAWGMNLQRREQGNERWEEIGTDENPLLNVALDISVGLAQIKPRTALTASVLATGQTPDTLPDRLHYEYRNVEPVGEGWPPRVVAKVVTPSPIPVPATRRSVALMLLDPESNLNTCALILALYQKQWEATNPDWSILERPEILATLYQIGFERSKPHGAPRSNAFGTRVRQVYEQPWLGRCFGFDSRTAPDGCSLQ